MVSLPVSVTVSAATNANLARLGFGLVQVPRCRVARELETGALGEVLADHPPTDSPVYVLYPEGRQLPPRVRTFLEWASAEITAGLATSWTGTGLQVQVHRRHPKISGTVQNHGRT